jgi:hypothetical protein
MPLLLQAGPYAHSPAKELVPPGWSQGNPQTSLLLVTEKQPTSISHRVERTVQPTA